MTGGSSIVAISFIQPAEAVVPEPGGRIHDAEVETEIVEPLVQEARHHGGRVLRRQEPERLLADPATPSLGHGHLERVGNARARHVERLDRRVPADPAKLLAHQRMELGPVSVGVDDRMAQAAAKLPGVGLRVGYAGPPWQGVAGWMIPPSRWAGSAGAP